MAFVIIHSEEKYREMGKQVQTSKGRCPIKIKVNFAGHFERDVEVDSERWRKSEQIPRDCSIFRVHCGCKKHKLEVGE